MKEELRERLRDRITMRDIREVCLMASGSANDAVKSILYELIDDQEERVGYNALWIFTHLPEEDRLWLDCRRSGLTDRVLKEQHPGKKRLMLTLLGKMTLNKEEVRGDYLEFCLSKINSTEPYAVRAWCLKQAFEMCRYYPELVEELKEEIAMMEYGELSPGLLSAKRQTERRIARLKS